MHYCHAEGCRVVVNPKILMCRRHWFQVPAQLRRAVWREYRPGQEVDKRPSPEYLSVMRAAIEAVAEKEQAAAPKGAMSTGHGQ